MSRHFEEYDLIVAYAPQSLAASTAATSDYVDASAVAEVEFDVIAAQLDASKTLKVEVYGATGSSGAGATKLAEKAFTNSGSSNTAGYVARVSILPQAAYSHYAVKITHANAAATVCGVAAVTEPIYCPPDTVAGIMV